jgi:hypothetical protein
LWHASSSTEQAIRYIVDADGKRIEVVLPVFLYKKLLAELEELESIRDFDEAMKDQDFVISPTTSRAIRSHV